MGHRRSIRSVFWPNELSLNADSHPPSDPGLASVLRRILPLATHFIGVEAFIDSR